MGCHCLLQPRQKDLLFSHGYQRASASHHPGALRSQDRCTSGSPLEQGGCSPPRAVLRTRSSASDARPGDAPEVAGRRSHLGLPQNGYFHFLLALQVSGFTWAGINEPGYSTEGNLRNSNVWIEKERLCRNPGSNQGPLDLQSNALPTELFRRPFCRPHSKLSLNF